MNTLIIESPYEAVLDVNQQPYAITPDAIKSLVRGKSSFMVFGEINKGNPAFKDWSKRLALGEKLPRGKFFRKEELMRAWINAPMPSSIHL
ncbi:hypothetical protein [Lelliottia amnigena]|jgi:hypothetical protein|uniref:hypothetical protein n=1 Tax=Lelliottia amnigena TaxID=61646 RepID=UPI001C23E0A1|nr:hypothetical protein [Lelliottia amnigena]QXB24174.1 hypothetical protein I6L76_23200 [Lelliottia amnigena]